MTFILSSAAGFDGHFSSDTSSTLHIVTGYENLSAGIRARRLIDAIFPNEGGQIHHAPYNYAMLARPDLKECIASRTAEASLVILSASYGPLPHYVAEWLERSARESRHEVRIIISYEDPPPHEAAEPFDVEKEVTEMAQRSRLHCHRWQDGALSPPPSSETHS